MPQYTVFTAYYQNAGGLRTKTTELFTAVKATDFDMILITETWLTENIYSAELFDPNYTVYRSDRNYEALSCTRGGGTLIAVKTFSDSGKLPGCDDHSFDDLWVMVRNNETTIIIGCVYFPPNSSVQAYQNFVDTLESIRRKHKRAKFLIAGDFNLPTVSWVNEEGLLVPSDLSSPMAETLITGMFLNELQQVNHLPNEFGRYLDLAFCDGLADATVEGSQYHLSRVVPHHIPLEMHFSLTSPPILKDDDEVVYNFDKADYPSLNRYLLDVDWQWLEKCNDVDNAVERFYAIIFEGIQRFVPERRIKRNKYPRWYTAETRKIINKKNRAYKRYRASRNQEDYRLYSVLRRESKHLIDLSYLLYVTNIEQAIPSNIKYFWSYINSLKKDSGIPKNMEYKHKIKLTSKEIVDSFAEHFESCYEDYSDRHFPNIAPQAECVLLTHHTFSPEEVVKRLCELDKSKSAGSDGIPPLFLKNCSSSLAAPLTSIFQISFSGGVFPALWKHSWLVPIFKSGSKKDIENYRGISLLPIVSKVFESIITDELFESFKHSISDDQHGFVRGRSTATNLGVFQDFLVNNVEKGLQVDVIYTDLAKAFDRVCHRLLIRKLSEMGVGGPYVRWLESYLKDRRQCVRIGNVESREITVTSGVPQGSHLGPILFLLFINSAASVFSTSKCLLYADDLKLFCPVNSLEDCLALQRDLDNLVGWCNLNALNININKCRVMRFYKCKSPYRYPYSIGNSVLESVHSFNDLGVIFSSDLSFNRHIDSVILKATRMLGFLRRTCSDVCDVRAIVSLFNCLVRSVLEYNSVIWCPMYNCHVQRLERVQNKFAKFLLYKLRFPYEGLSYQNRIQLAGIESLERRRQNALVLFLFKLINGQMDCSSLLSLILLKTPQRTTRSRQVFHVRHHRTNYGSQSFCDRLMKNYDTNFGSVDLFMYSFDVFKQRIRNR